MSEYPKALYRSGAYLAVQDAVEEKNAREEGWANWTEDRAAIGLKPDSDDPPELKGSGGGAGGLTTGSGGIDVGSKTISASGGGGGAARTKPKAS